MTQSVLRDEAADTRDEPAVLLAGELDCDQCGSRFLHEGRGRKPKRCPECRASSRARGPAPSSAAEESAPRRARGIEALEKNLQTQLTMLGMGLVFLDPFDAQVVVKNAQQGAKALANLAATNPSVKRALEKSVEAAGYGPVLLWMVQTSIPILAHHGFIRGVADPAHARPAPTSPGGGAGNGQHPVDLGALAEMFGRS